jgi:hypothetical protein
MNLHEISLVDRGAGLGATVILTKRDVSGEARDALGRWTSSAANATAAGAKVMVDLAHNLAVESAKNAGHVVANTKLMDMQPVANGGLQFHMRSATRSGAAIHTYVQVRPEHVKGNGILSEVLRRTHNVLSAYGRAMVPPINGLFRGAYIPPNGAYDSGAARSFGSGSGNKILDAARAAVTPATPAQAAVTISADDMKRSQGVRSPDNDIPMNVARQVKMPGTNSFMPLNHPTIDSTNAGGHPYLNEYGNYIPAGSAEKQAFIDKNNNAEAFAKLPTYAGPEKSNGAGYINSGGHVIPPGNVEQQRTYEGRYAQWDKDSDAVMAAMNTLPTAREVPTSSVSGLSKDIPITRVPAGPKPDDSLHWSEADKKPSNPYSFGKRRAPSLFSECGNIYLFKRDETPKLFSSPSVRPELFRKSTA